MKLKYILLAAATLIATLSYSQEEKTYWSKVGFLGAAHLNPMDDFNTTLMANGFSPVVSEGTYGEVYAKRARRDSRFIGTFAFTFYSRGSDPLTTDPSGAFGNRVSMLGLGLSSGTEYQLIKNKSFFINPGIYVNLDYYRLSFSEGVGNASLDNILNSEDLKTYSAASLQVPVLLGLNMGVHFPVGQMRVGLVGYAGYRLHYDNASWTLNDSVTLEDEINLSGVQVGLGLEFYFTDGELKR